MWNDADVAHWYETLPKEDEVLSHFGGAYDFLYLISITPHLKWNGGLAGSNLVSCRAKGHARCRDTFRLFPLSLDTWTRQKSEIGLECICGNKCSGYCAISRSLPRAKLEMVRDYCMQDCRALLRTYLQDVERLIDDGLLARNDKGGVRSTIGGVAWHTAATMAQIAPNGRIDWDDYEAGRRGYYGGRNEVGRVRAKHGYRDDVNGMYPWALTQDVPFGTRFSYQGSSASRAFDEHELGIFHAEVEVPESPLPSLPHRYEGETDGRLTKDRLVWATGHMSGYWSGIELRNALDRGVKIKAIISANVWSQQGPLFREYVEHVYACRRRAKENGDDRWASVLKWFANALSGRLAMRAESTALVVLGPDEDPAEGWEQHGGPDSRVYSITSTRTPSSGMTWVAATLTSRARVKLDRRLARHIESWLYCDTDSTYLVNRDLADVDEYELGMFKYEGEINDWRALAPKLYRYRDENDKWHVRARGVPRATYDAFEALRQGFSVTAEGGVERIKSSGGRFVARTVTRSHLDHGTNRCGTRFILRDGSTRPIHRTADGRYI